MGDLTIAEIADFHDATIPSVSRERSTAKPGIFVVDATWGVTQPISLAPGAHRRRARGHRASPRRATNRRLPAPRVHRGGTIASVFNIPHGEIAQRVDEVDPIEPTVVFCNGPQRPATAQATEALVAADWPAERLLYYRGGNSRLGDARPPLSKSAR